MKQELRKRIPTEGTEGKGIRTVILKFPAPFLERGDKKVFLPFLCGSNQEDSRRGREKSASKRSRRLDREVGRGCA